MKKPVRSHQTMREVKQPPLPEREASEVDANTENGDQGIQKADPGLAVTKLKILLDFQYQSIVQTVDLLTKGVTYYFTITAVVVGVLFTRGADPALRSRLAIAAMIVSTLLAVIIIAMSYGVLKGLGAVKRTLELIDRDNFDKMEMAQYFRRGRTVGVVVTICCLMILVTLVVVISASRYL